MLVAGEGRNPTEKHLLALAQEADVDLEQAGEIIQHVKDVVACWQDYARKANVSKESTAMVQEAVWMVFASLPTAMAVPCAA